MVNLKTIIIGALGYCYEYRHALTRALLIPIAILVGLSIAESINIFQPEDALISISINIISWVIYATFAITVHRIVLEGPGSVPKWGIYKITMREFRFIVYTFAIALVSLPAMILVLIPYIGVFLALGIFTYIMSRLSLVFPSIALNQSPSLSGSWYATKNYQLIMFSIVIVLPLGTSVPQILLENIPGLSVFVTLISCVATVFVVATLSVAYRLILEDLTVDTTR